MEEIVKYENSINLYYYLIDDFGFSKIEDKYFPERFGNYSIVLKGEDFSLRYYNDRSYLSIDISSNYDNKWFALSFVKDLIYDPENINAQADTKDNGARIKELNNFLKKDFAHIKWLFDKETFLTTRKKLEAELKKQFFLQHPNLKK